MLQGAGVGNADPVRPKSREAADNIGQLMQTSRLAATATTEPAAKENLLVSPRSLFSIRSSYPTDEVMRILMCLLLNVGLPLLRTRSTA